MGKKTPTPEMAYSHLLKFIEIKDLPQGFQCGGQQPSVFLTEGKVQDFLEQCTFKKKNNYLLIWFTVCYCSHTMR